MKKYREKLKLPGSEKILEEQQVKTWISQAKYRRNKKPDSEFHKKKLEEQKLRRHKMKASLAGQHEFNSRRDLRKAVN